MAITIKIPLQTSNRKEKQIDTAIQRQAELARFFDNHIKNFPKTEWGGRPSKGMRNLPKKKEKFGKYGKNGLAQTHYKNQLFRHINDMYRNMLDGVIKEPSFQNWNNLILCNCGVIKEDEVNRNNSHIKYDLENGGVRISLLDEKDPVWFKMRLGNYHRKLFEKSLGTGSNCKMVKKGNRYELHQSLTMPKTNTDYKPETVIGVDFNFDRLAVATFLDQDGNVKTADFNDYGRQLKDYRQRQRKVRREYQKKHLTKRVEENRSKEERRIENTLHTIAYNIVKKAGEMEKPVIKIEDTEIQQMRKQVNQFNKNWFKTSINQWPVGKLKDYIQYKAELEHIKVKLVNPRDTSKKCHKCNTKGKRPRQRDFICTNKNCENYNSRIDADINATLNIAEN